MCRMPWSHHCDYNHVPATINLVFNSFCISSLQAGWSFQWSVFSPSAKISNVFQIIKDTFYYFQYSCNILNGETSLQLICATAKQAKQVPLILPIVPTSPGNEDGPIKAELTMIKAWDFQVFFGMDHYRYLLLRQSMKICDRWFSTKACQNKKASVAEKDKILHEGAYISNTFLSVF